MLPLVEPIKITYVRTEYQSPVSIFIVSVLILEIILEVTLYITDNFDVINCILPHSIKVRWQESAM